MQIQKVSIEDSTASLVTILKRFCIAVVFGIAFGYIEAAIVVYLREIFYPGGFTFPLDLYAMDAFGKRLPLTEVGRETSTIILILSACWLFGKNLQQRIAYFLTIFAVWDIFYYIWLKVLLDWPASIMDWDILFLIPLPWAGPVLAPVLTSMVMLLAAWIMLYRDNTGRPVKASLLEFLILAAGGFTVVVSFCIAGQHTEQANYAKYFYWPTFTIGLLLTIAAFARCLLKSKTPAR
jgi:hypothetical protein